MPEKNRSFVAAVNNLMETSSAHGLPNIHRSKSMLSKTCWTILFLTSVTILIIQVVYLLKQYLKYEHITSLDVRFERTLNFPAVTVCNINPVLHSKLASTSAEFREKFDVSYGPPDDNRAWPKNGAPASPNPGEPGNEQTGGSQTSGGATTSADQLNNETTSNNSTVDTDNTVPSGGTNTMTVEQFTDTSSTGTAEIATTQAPVVRWGDGDQDEFFMNRSSDYLLEQDLISQLANFTDTEQAALGHDLDAMLLECLWKGYPCTSKNFTSFFHYKYGNCYTFNSLKVGDSLTTNRPGPLFGLTMELYLEQGEYLPEITEAAGFRVVIHERETMPFPEDDGIDISPGFKTAVAVRVVNVQRLSSPYGNCTVKAGSTANNIYTRRYNVSHSLKACERSCYQLSVIDNCTCFDPHYPKPPDDTTEPCSIENKQAVQCVGDLDRQYKEGTLSCNCFQLCNETSYLTSTSSSLWPADQFQEKLFRDIVDRNEDVRTYLHGDSKRDWVVKNVAKLEVFFQEFNYEYIKQTEAYTLLGLASDIGGHLGLWLGLSVLTLFEVVQHLGVFVRVLGYNVWNCTRRNDGVKKHLTNSLHAIHPSKEAGIAMDDDSKFT